MNSVEPRFIFRLPVVNKSFYRLFDIIWTHKVKMILSFVWWQSRSMPMTLYKNQTTATETLKRLENFFFIVSFLCEDNYLENSLCICDRRIVSIAGLELLRCTFFQKLISITRCPVAPAIEHLTFSADLRCRLLWLPTIKNPIRCNLHQTRTSRRKEVCRRQVHQFCKSMPSVPKMRESGGENLMTQQEASARRKMQKCLKIIDRPWRSSAKRKQQRNNSNITLTAPIFIIPPTDTAASDNIKTEILTLHRAENTFSWFLKRIISLDDGEVRKKQQQR